MAKLNSFFCSGFVFSLLSSAAVVAENYYTFDGPPDFVACYNVTSVEIPKSVDEAVSVVQTAVENNHRIKTSGLAHMWYDTLCSDQPTTILKTDNLTQITDFDLEGGSVTIEAGVTFFQLADYLHERNASIGTRLVNWNMTVVGALATGSHRMSLSNDSIVSSGALAMDIINGKGELVHLDKDESDDTWLAATVSLGLLGTIARVKFAIMPEFKLTADQKILDEDDFINGDMEAMIAPYPTANFWWYPGIRKVHYRYYNYTSNDTPGESLQSTFSISQIEADTAKALLNPGQNSSAANFVAESTFFAIWSAPNFHDKNTNLPILSWPTVGWSYDVLIGGLYPGSKTEWEAGLHGYTFEIACPMTQSNAFFKRIRELFDAEGDKGMPMASTYRSGINIKFGLPFNGGFLAQTIETDSADWSKGAVMFDFPTFRPDTGNHSRYNEPFYHSLAKTLIDEFPVRAHWTKNTRDVFQQATKNLDANNLKRFNAVRQQFDPNNLFMSVVGEILGFAS